MSVDYANATIAGAATSGPPGSPAVQPPIGWNALTAANTEQWNGDIGVEQGTTVAASVMATPVVGAGYPGSPGMAGIDNLGAAMTWATCVAGCSAGATGTLTGAVFVVGAGAAVAKAAIPAGGYGWVKN